MKIEVRNLHVNFSGKKILKNINLNLTPGIWGLLGANGAGKTTLIKVLSTILKPTEGEILFNGKNVFSEPQNYLINLGVLPQGFDCYPNVNICDFLKFMAIIKEIPSSQIEERIIRVLKTTNLLTYSNLKIKQLSGGMKQRLGIAQVLLSDPLILIFDEPTVGLDPEERVMFRKLLSTLSNDKIILLSTHIVQDVEAIADKLLVMSLGQIILNGSPNELLQNIHGLVWECTDINSSEHIISNIRHNSNGDTIYRIISSEAPHINAKQVSANLEDLYLFYFHQKYIDKYINKSSYLQINEGELK